MKEKILFCTICIIILFQGTSTFAQRNPYEIKLRGDTNSYKIIRNDPENIQNFCFMLSPFYADINGYNTNFGYAIGLAYNCTNTFKFDASYSCAYIETTRTNAISEEVKPNNDGQSSQNIELGLTIFLRKMLIEKQHRVLIYTEGEKEYYNNLGGKAFYMFGIRGGYQYYNSVIDGSRFLFNGSSIGEVKTTDGSSFAVPLNESILSFGLSGTIIHDLIVNYTNFGEKKNRYMLNYYVDLLYATTIVYGDISVLMAYPRTIGFEYLYSNVNVDQYSQKSRFGGRLGMSYNNLNKFAFTPSLEVGIRPGYNVVGGIYALLKFNFGLNKDF
jgi:hypothetical protein